MLTLPREADQNKVEEAIASPEEPEGMNVSYVLLIDGEDFSHKISSEQGEWGTEETGVNYCDLVLTTPLPRRLEGAPAKFFAVINGVEVPQVVGIDSESEIGEDRASTDPFHSASAGRLANESTLDEDIDINGWYPEQVVRKATLKLPYNRTRVDALAAPTLYFTRAEDTYFKKEQHPSNMLSAVQAKAPYLFIDTYTGGFLASASLFLKRGSVPLRTYDADDMRGSGSEGMGWRPPVRAEPRYSGVVVFRRNPDDSYAFEASANIIYRGQKFIPKNRTFYVELEDPTGDGPAQAQQLAYDLASRFSRGVYKNETVLPSLDALLMRGDSFSVDDLHRDAEGSYQRRWLCWVETIKKSITNPLPIIGYSAALVLEDKLDVPKLALAGISARVKRALWGPYPPDYFYIDESVPWITGSGDYFTIDETLSGGVVTESGDYFTVN